MNMVSKGRAISTITAVTSLALLYIGEGGAFANVTPIFDTGPAIIGHRNSVSAPSDNDTVVIGRLPSDSAGSAYHVIGRMNGAWYKIIADAAGGDFQSDPAAVYMDTPSSKSDLFMVCGRAATDNGIQCSKQHIIYQTGRILDVVDEVASRVGTKSFAFNANPALARKYIGDTVSGSVGTFLYARAFDGQIWQNFRPDGGGWGAWSQLPAVTGGLGDPAAISVDDRYMMVCAVKQSTGQLTCTGQALFGDQFGHVHVGWAGWVDVPGFAPVPGGPFKPALTRTKEGIFLLSVLDGSPNHQFYSFRPTGGSWSTVGQIGPGTGFGTGPAATGSPNALGVMTINKGSDGAYWYALSTSTPDNSGQLHFSGWNGWFQLQTAF